MSTNKFSTIFRGLKIVGGLIAISYAVYSGNHTFFLGVIPFVAGIINFRPICFITGKC